MINQGFSYWWLVNGNWQKSKSLPSSVHTFIRFSMIEGDMRCASWLVEPITYTWIPNPMVGKWSQLYRATVIFLSYSGAFLMLLQHYTNIYICCSCTYPWIRFVCGFLQRPAKMSTFLLHWLQVVWIPCTDFEMELSQRFTKAILDGHKHFIHWHSRQMYRQVIFWLVNASTITRVTRWCLSGKREYWRMLSYTAYFD